MSKTTTQPTQTNSTTPPNHPTNPTPKYTLLLCTYAKENPNHLSQCLKSILTQTHPPDELIIVKDGPLPESLETVISNIFPEIDTHNPNNTTTSSNHPIASITPKPPPIPHLTIIPLPKNVTQGIARSKGVKASKNEWIALMDADDICLPDRFKKQLTQIAINPQLDLIGGQISEFKTTPENPTSKRTTPTTHKEILTQAKHRNPFNAMTTMFKRSLALEAGNFRYFPGFEDYDLWTRMIAKGANCANHPDILVHVRVGSGMYTRRKGLAYIQAEWQMQKQLKTLGITTTYNLIRNILTRIPIRLLPSKLLAFIYKHLARSK